MSSAATTSDSSALTLEEHRVGLTAYCYRMLGSGFEAEDAVQETLVRAWQAMDRYDARRAAVKTWLYAIATNVCFDMQRSVQRRAEPMRFGPASQPGSALGAPLPDTTWVQPMPDHRTINADPAEITAQRASVRLAFVAALQYLPARQRAVLILRDVLQWKANEVAQLLDSSVASVNSALQRARSTLATREVSTADTFEPTDDRQRALLARYVDAFERHDIKALTSLLHEDATMSMPPFAWWLRGRGQIADAMLHADSPCRDSRFVATAANGVPAYGQYVPTGPDGSYQPWALVMIDIVGDRIAGLSSFLNAGQLFPLFDLPSLGPAVSVGCSA